MASKKHGGFALRTVKGRAGERDFTQLVDKDTGTPLQGVTELRVTPLSQDPNNNQVIVTMILANVPTDTVEPLEGAPVPDEGAGSSRADAEKKE